MQYFFASDYSGKAFQIFSDSHLFGLLTVALFNFFLIYILRRLKSEKINRIVALSGAFLLIIQELSLSIWRITCGTWQIATSLPLHLCGMGIILAAVMLVKRDEKLYRLLYFWATAGATQALLQPDIGIYGFPHYRFFQFFLSHGLLLTAVVYATFILNFRPYFRSIYKAFVMTNIFAIFVGLFNFLFDSNYMFLTHKPETNSIMDFLGPWPFYLIPLEFLMIFLYTLVYMPFLIRDLRIKVIAERRKSI
jgi:hypothetical integral membrane protein (TIGR02206 family)